RSREKHTAETCRRAVETEQWALPEQLSPPTARLPGATPAAMAQYSGQHRNSTAGLRRPKKRSPLTRAALAGTGRSAGCRQSLARRALRRHGTARRAGTRLCLATRSLIVG